MYKKILVALDRSDDAKRAAEKAIEIAKGSNAKVVIFHSIKHQLRVMLPPIIIAERLNSSQIVAYEDIREDRKIEGKNLLDNAIKMFKQENIDVEGRLITSENPEDYITRIVDEEDFDLLVLGCKGEHSFAKRVLMGTIPQITLNRASCDILIVR